MMMTTNTTVSKKMPRSPLNATKLPAKKLTSKQVHKPKHKQPPGVRDKNFDTIVHPQMSLLGLNNIGLNANLQTTADSVSGTLGDMSHTLKVAVNALSGLVPANPSNVDLIKELVDIRQALQDLSPKSFKREATTAWEGFKNSLPTLGTSECPTRVCACIGALVGAGVQYVLFPDAINRFVFHATFAVCVVYIPTVNGVSIIGHITKFVGDVYKNAQYPHPENDSPPESEDDVHPQMDFSTLEFMTTAAATLLCGFSTAVAGRKIPMELFKGLGSLGRVKQSLTDIMNVVISCVEKVYNYVRNNVFKLPSQRFLQTNSSVVNEFLSEIDKILEKERKCQFYRNIENYEKLSALIGVGDKLMLKLPRDSASAAAIEAVRNILRDLNTLRKAFEASNFTLSGSRQEPVCVLFKGGPGVGKSICMEHLNYAVCSALLEPDEFEAFQQNPSTFVFNRQFENKYWDGYDATKFITMFDDFGQLKDQGTNPDGEAANVLRAGSGFNYALHAAELTAKGNMNFRSKFLFGTTNLKKLDFESLLDNEALLRRWDHTYVVTPRPEYSAGKEWESDLYKRRFDVSKLPTVEVEDMETRYKPGMSYITNLDPEMQHFHRVDKFSEEIIGGNPLTFKEVVDEVLETYRIKRQRYIRASTSFDETSEKYRLMFSEPDYPCDCDVCMETLEDDQYDKCPYATPVPQADYDAEYDEYQSCDDPDGFHEYPEEIRKALGSIRSRTSYPKAHPYDVDEILYGVGDEEKSLVKFALANVGTWKTRKQHSSWRHLRKLVRETFGPSIDANDYHPAVVLNNLLNRWGIPFFEAYIHGLNYDPGWQTEEVEFVIPYKPFSFPNYEGAKNFFNSLWKKASDWWENSYFKLIFETFLEFKGTFLAIAGLVTAYKAYQVWNFDDTSAQSFGFSDKMKTTKPKTKFVGKNSVETRAALRAVRPQGSDSIDGSGVDLMKSILRTSSFQLYTETRTGTNSYNKPGDVFHLRGTIILMPYHFIPTMQSCVEEDETYLDAKVKLKRNFGERSTEYIFTIEDFLLGFRDGVLRDNDMVLVDLGDRLQVGTDRVPNFALRDDYIRNNSNIPSIVPVWTKDTREYSLVVAQSYDKTLDVMSKDIGDYKVRRSYTYKAMTSAGDCGALFCVLNAACQKRKIFGMHIAGNSRGNGYAGAVCQEDLLIDLTLFEPQVEASVEVKDLIEDDAVIAQGQFTTLGRIKKPPSSPSQTRIIRSALHSTWTAALTGTAQLTTTERDGKTIAPLLIALNKYCYPAVPFPRDGMKEVEDCYANDLAAQVPNRDARIWTLREAVNGVFEDTDSHGVAADTSAGYPMSNDVEFNWKKYLFAKGREGEEFEKRLKEYQAHLDPILDKYRRRVRPTWIFTDCLKDERRPLEKCLNGSTRLFSACPFDYLVIFKMYFGAFQLTFMQTRIDNGSSVGVNPYSPEWHDIAMKLSKYDTDEAFVGAGDYSGYDGKEKPQIHWMIFRLIAGWYQGNVKDYDIRHMLWLEVVNSKHIACGYLVEWCSSLPSGHPFTIIINCLYNHILFRLCWFDAGLPVGEFLLWVYLIVCGDDNVFTVHPSFRDKFNELTLCESMAKFGMIYTTELKAKALVPFRRLTEVEFLKRGFRWEATIGRYVAPLRLDVVLEIPFWTKKGADADNITASNTLEALRELSLHGEAVYKEWSGKIIPVFEERCPHIIPSKPLRQRFVDRLRDVSGMAARYH